MRFLSRVVWSEGMHLSPQHFQTQSRYFEDSLWFLNSNLYNYPWGLLSLALDSDAVRNGLAILRYASGVFPDGLVFEVPDSDPRPSAAQPEGHLHPGRQRDHLLYLAVPARRGQGLDSDLANGASARYGTFERVLRDETISEDEYPVVLGRKNLKLCSAAQVANTDQVAMPVARILRDGKGGFVSDPAFLPPLLRIGVVEDLLQPAQTPHRLHRREDFGHSPRKEKRWPL